MEKKEAPQARVAETEELDEAEAGGGLVKEIAGDYEYDDDDDYEDEDEDEDDEYDDDEGDGQDIVLDVSIDEAGYEAGDKRISGISFQVRRGELLGLIGPNGAGKSTTIKTLLGLLKHAKARVKIGGEHQSYAYVPEQPVFYEDLSLWEHLDLAAAAYGLPYEKFEATAGKLLTQFGMDNVRDDLPAGFSKGMKQKMMLMLGFLVQPDVYIVDEPFIGLDPRATKDFLRLLEAERKRGAGVLMSTHVLDTAEKICDRFVLISGGKMTATGTLEEIRDIADLPGGSLFDCFDELT